MAASSCVLAGRRGKLAPIGTHPIQESRALKTQSLPQTPVLDAVTLGSSFNIEILGGSIQTTANMLLFFHVFLIDPHWVVFWFWLL